MMGMLLERGENRLFTLSAAATMPATGGRFPNSKPSAPPIKTKLAARASSDAVGCIILAAIRLPRAREDFTQSEIQGTTFPLDQKQGASHGKVVGIAKSFRARPSRRDLAGLDGPMR